MQGLNITQQKTLLRASPFKFSIKHFMGFYSIWLTNQKNPGITPKLINFKKEILKQAK